MIQPYMGWAIQAQKQINFMIILNVCKITMVLDHTVTRRVLGEQENHRSKNDPVGIVMMKRSLGTGEANLNRQQTKLL